MNPKHVSPGSAIITRVLIPLVASFVAVYVLGWFITELFVRMQLLVPSPTHDDALTVLVFQLLAPYTLVVIVSLLFFRKDRLRLAALIVGPILLTLLVIYGVLLLFYGPGLK